MANSTLTLYQTNILVQKNMYVDNVSDYLNTCGKVVINDFQYIKHGLDITIKVNANQRYIDDYQLNYAKIQNENEDYYLYFILGTKWISANTIQLELSMDTINTFQDIYQFSNKTKIIRQHKDRYYKYAATTSSTKFNKLIDNVDEGISGVPMVRTSNALVAASSSYQPNFRWNLVYMSDEEEGMKILAYPSDYIKISNDLPTNTHMDFLERRKIYFLNSMDNPLTYEVKINGVTEYNPQILFRVLNSGNIEYRYFNTTYDAENDTWIWRAGANPIRTVNMNAFNIVDGVNLRKVASSSNTIFADLSELTDSFIKGKSIYDFDFRTDATYIMPISKIDRTDSRIIKIIEFPYAPCNMVATSGLYSFDVTKFEYSEEYAALRLINFDTSLTSTITATSNVGGINTTLPAYNTRKSLLRDDTYESKLLHSAFFKYKYVYDSFSYQIPLELMQATSGTSSPKITVYQYMNKSAQSAVAFKFSPSYLSTTYQEDFGEWLIANRNNEQMVLNNEYINYIKNGYNYDVKNKDQQNAFNWLGTGIQIVGAAIALFAGAAASGATGGISAAAGISLAVSATASIASNINTAITNENSISQKLAELRNQSASVITSDSLDLFHEYSGNQLRLMQYKPSANISKSIANLFHYCGYADGTQGIPNTDTRRWFNYVQCEAVFVNEDDVSMRNYLDDIKARFSVGVTYYHKANNGDTTWYDFEQHYENFETWICGRE